MNVKQLKEELENYPDDLIVRFQYYYGDPCHNRIVAHEVEYIDVVPVKQSDYVGDFVVDDNEDGNFIEDENTAVVFS